MKYIEEVFDRFDITWMRDIDDVFAPFDTNDTTEDIQDFLHFFTLLYNLKKKNEMDLCLF